MIPPTISPEIFVQFGLPMAQAYSVCIVEKNDLNTLYTQSAATLKALANDVAIANTAKQEAENLLSQKKLENESCNTARSTCDADKATLDSKYQACNNECETSKMQLKSEKTAECEGMINAKNSLILETNVGKNNMEYVAMGFGVFTFLTWGLIGFLYYKNRIK